MPARSRGAAFAAAALLLVAVELLLAAKTHVLFGDYRAFYCAGGAVLRGADPYATASLYACEHAAQPWGLYSALPGVAVPAPLPGYALLLFATFAMLPYTVSCVAWFAVLLGSCVCACIALARLVRRPLAGAIALLAAGFAIAVIPYGELASIVIAALLLMAVALRRGAWNAAAIAAAFTAILPHVAVPALLAVFIGKAPMRARLAAVAAVLAALDFAAGGIARAAAYFTNVLPAHALSEVGSTTQFGLTWALHALGSADKPAILGGEVCYAVMMAAGLAAGIALARRLREDAFLVLLPPAFAVFGGTFMHYSEILAALPAAMLLLANVRGPLRTSLMAAAALLAFPWGACLSQPMLVAVFAAGGAALIWMLADSATAAIRAASAFALLGACIILAAAHFGPALAAHSTHAVTHSTLAQASWSEYVRTQRASSGIIWWIVKAPTWIGLALLTFCGAYVFAKEDLVPPVVVEQVPVGS